MDFFIDTQGQFCVDSLLGTTHYLIRETYHIDTHGAMRNLSDPANSVYHGKDTTKGRLLTRYYSAQQGQCVTLLSAVWIFFLSITDGL